MTIAKLSEAMAQRRAATPIEGITEDDLASEFTRRHRGHLRYVADWSRWMHWDGQRWELEKTLRAFHLARVVCRDLAKGLITLSCVPRS